MKKTIIAILALSSFSTSATTLADFTQLTTTTKYTWDTTTQGAAPKSWTIALTLDASVLQPYMERGTTLYGTSYTGEIPEGALISGDASSGFQIIDVTLNNTGSSRIGLDTNFSGGSWSNEMSSINSSGIYGSWNGGGSSNAAVGNYALASPDFATTTFDWDKVGAIAITLSYQYQHTAGNGANMSVAIFDKDGSQIGSTTYGSNAYLRTDAALASITFSSAVTSAYLLNERVAETDAKAIVSALGKSAVIPEPTAATLSLLALAGLAARRRRK